MHENTNAYKCLFRESKKYIKNTFDYNWEPEFIVCDGADAIMKAAKEIWPNIIVLLCLFHMIKAVLKNCPSSLNSMKGYIKWYLDILIECSDKVFYIKIFV